MGKTRLDQKLVNLSLFDSRARAASAIKAGLVRVNGKPAVKAAMSVSDGDEISAAGEHEFVSRGGMKLAAALAHFDYRVSGGTFADIGASTGGFTDVLLQHGAAHVFAVDVGQDQLHAKLRQDERVRDMSAINARHLTAEDFDRALDGLVCDVSFISQTKALAALLPLMPEKSWALSLIKPQFELDKSALGKNGVVSNAALRHAACEAVQNWWQSQNWHVDGVIESPITGPQGNVEFLLAARRI
ncbi:MAG: TlyA family RNA methyltransferase [Parvibaculales bacterium]